MHLADLHRAIQTTLASKRLGRPVFVRYIVQGQDKADRMAARLAHVTAVVRQWMAQSLDRIYAVGTIDAGQVSLTLQFRDGATALVSFARGQPSGVDVMVLGSRGALYHDAGSANAWEDPAAAQTIQPDAALHAVIERALRSGRPEAVSAEDRP